MCPQAALRLADIVLLGPQPALQIACAERLGLQAPPQVLLGLPGARLPRSQAGAEQRLHTPLLPEARIGGAGTGTAGSGTATRDHVAGSTDQRF